MKRSIDTKPKTRVFLNRLKISRVGLIWLGASLVVGFIGWLRSVNVVFLLSYFMLSLLIINICLAFLNVRRVGARREPLAPVHVGEETVIKLTIDNVSSRAATLLVDDCIAGQTVGWMVSDLPGKTSASCY